MDLICIVSVFVFVFVCLLLFIFVLARLFSCLIHIKKKFWTGSATESKQPPPPPPPPAEEPFDNSKYQATELYEYNPMSFFDMEVDMSVSRCPQPSSLRKAS